MERAGGAPMADTIRCEVSDNVAQITLDDGKVNAMALAFFAGLNAALDRAEHERPGALVIAGRAGVFSAGLDLKVLPTLAPDALERTMIAFGRTINYRDALIGQQELDYDPSGPLENVGGPLRP